MEEYLSYFSAASLWDIPNSQVIFSPKTMDNEASSGVVGVLGGMPAEVVDIPLGKQPMDLTVPEHKASVKRKGFKLHKSTLPLPDGAVVRRNGRNVASPELVFLQLAEKLSIHQLILLGLQLCSHSPGQPSGAITSKEKLKAFLVATSGHRGHRKALQALQYLENGSASIMESITYMVLTLPHALGGYGLKGALFNKEIKLREDSAKLLKQERCFIDLYYPYAKIGVEYDSFAFHSSPTEQGKDLLRATSLSRQGIDIMRISTIQLYDKGACKEFALMLASRLGKRINIRTERFEEMQRLLLALLPKRDFGVTIGKESGHVAKG